MLGRPRGSGRGHQGPAYEIPHGVGEVTGGEPFLDGVRHGSTWGTIWHGAFENDDFRRAWLTTVAEAVGSTWRAVPGQPRFAGRRAQVLGALPGALVEHVDLDALLARALG